MIRHILQILWNQRKSNGWILAELAVISFCLWSAVDYVGQAWNIRQKPLGYTIENTYRLDLHERQPGSDGYVSAEMRTTRTGEDILMIADQLRLHPWVENVSVSIASQPYSTTWYGGRARYNRLLLQDTVGITVQVYQVTPSFFDVFGIHPAEGRVTDLKDDLSAHSLIVSSVTTDELNAGNTMTGLAVRLGEEGMLKQVSAECVPVRWTEYIKPNPCVFVFLSDQELLDIADSGYLEPIEVCFRVKPDVPADLKEVLLSEFSGRLQAGNLYIMDIRSTSLIRRSVVAPIEAAIQNRLFIMSFLLINIFIGISGTFWLRTRARVNEIGLRTAVGSTKKQLQLLFTQEGLFMLLLATIPSILVSLQIGLAELVDLYWADFTLWRFVRSTGITFGIMAILILCGIIYPVWKASRINAAEALHNE